MWCLIRWHFWTFKTWQAFGVEYLLHKHHWFVARVAAHISPFSSKLNSLNIPRNFLEIHPANSWKYLFANSQSHVGDRGILRKLLPNCEIYTWNHQLSWRPPVGVAGSIDVEHPLLVNLFVLAPRKSPRPPALNMPACRPRCHTVGANSRTRPVRETKRSRLHSMNTPRLSKVHVRTAAPSLPNLFALEWIVSTTIVATSRVTWLLVALHVTTWSERCRCQPSSGTSLWYAPTQPHESQGRDLPYFLVSWTFKSALVSLWSPLTSRKS